MEAVESPLVGQHGHNRPPRYNPRSCAECGTEFTPSRVDQLFCTDKAKRCKDTSHNRELVRSRELYRLAYHWVAGNGRGQRGSLIGAMSATVRRWRDEDRKAGRKPPPLPEELVARKQSARMGYVRRDGVYVRDAEGAALVLEELS